MATIDTKKKIFNQIAALKTLNDGFPSFNISNSLSSINNKQNSVDFLVDLLKTLVGYEELKDGVINLLSFEMDKIETTVKKTLKKNLKEYINCGSNPAIPNFLLNTGDGVNLEIGKIDFTDLMHTDPTSQYGGLLYDDTNSGINSTDFNTYLFSTIQNGSPQNWPSNATNQILTIGFKPTGTVNNVINVKATSYYSNNKTLSDLNNDYIDSINLLPSDKVINNIIDSLFGTISLTYDKSNSSLLVSEKLNTIIDNLINTTDNSTIDNTYFQFSNDEVRVQQETASNRKNGIKKLDTCDNIETSIDINTLSELTNAIQTSTNPLEKKDVITKGLNTMANELTSNVSGPDNENIKLHFIDLLVKKLIQSIINMILSPKLITLFALNHKIVNGVNSTFNGPIDFIEQNRVLFKSIVDSIRDEILDYLLNIAIKEITNLVEQQILGNLTERATTAKSQIISLLGVQPEVIRKINKLG